MWAPFAGIAASFLHCAAMRHVPDLAVGVRWKSGVERRLGHRSGQGHVWWRFPVGVGSEGVHQPAADDWLQDSGLVVVPATVERRLRRSCASAADVCVNEKNSWNTEAD